jgi:hypothetical protein
MSYSYGDFRGEVSESVDNDPRYESMLDVACNRGIDEIFAESDFGNFRYDTNSIAGREEYDLPADTLYVNNVTYDNLVLSRCTFAEFLNRKSWLNFGNTFRGYPDKYVVKDNRSLMVTRTPADTDKVISIYVTIKTADLSNETDADEDFPLARVYSKPAYHFARHYLFGQDLRTEEAASEYKMFEHEMAKIARRLSGSIKTKVKRIH